MENTKEKTKLNLISLDQKFGIILPKTGNNGEDYTEKIEKIAELFAKKFGGSSIQNITGYWIGERTYKDHNVIVYSYSDTIDWDFITDIVSRSKIEFNQEAIAFEYNNQLHITI